VSEPLTLDGLLERLNDSEALEWFVFEIFYANPIAFARRNLVIALQRHLKGEPLVTPEEAQARMLDELSAEDRAAWWRAENARRLSERGVAVPPLHADHEGGDGR
jgi:hypothetical protein